GDVLQALPAGAEGVVVDAGDAVDGGGTGDVEDLVLLGLLGQREGDAGDDGAAEDLVVLTDQVLGRCHRGVRDTRDVAVGDLGGEGDAGLEALLVLRTVGRQRTGLGVDDADLVGVAATLLSASGVVGGVVGVAGVVVVVVVVVGGVSVVGRRGAGCQRQDRGHR